MPVMDDAMDTRVSEPWMGGCLPSPPGAPPAPSEETGTNGSRHGDLPVTTIITSTRSSPPIYVALKCCTNNPTNPHQQQQQQQHQQHQLQHQRNPPLVGDAKDAIPKALRPHSTPATLSWLEENYEIADGICIPRSTLYLHYVDFCERNAMQPVNAASFGKIIRQQFPQLTTRRLGTRGQSRYHYYGIAVRDTSPYYEVTFSKKGLNNAGDLKKEVIRQVMPYSQRPSKVSSLLPEFPSAKDLRLPPTVAEDKVATFVMMYRTHCQRVLDTIIRASFDEVQSFLLHFWQGMPSHILAILGSNVIVNVVGVCDSILYRAISNVLLPSILQPLPDSLTQVIRKFAKDLELWVRLSLEGLPDNLTSVKFDLVRRFSQTLRRQISLNHLCQAFRMVLHNPDVTPQMLQDWRHIEADSISRQTLYTMEPALDGAFALHLITTLCREFESLLEEQSPIEAYVDWLETMVERCVVQPSRKKKIGLRPLARQFLLMWSSFGTRVIRDMTLHSASSFGSFHLLHLVFDDYVLYLVESLYAEERMKELYSNIATDTPPSFPDTEETFGDPDGNMNKIKWYNSPATALPENMLSNPSMIIAGTSPTPPSGSDVISSQPSPVQEMADASSVMRENCVIAEESVASVSPQGDQQMVQDYSSASANEHYSGMYTYGNYDGRNGYRHVNNATLTRQETRPYTYSNNQYTVMAAHSEGNNHVEARNLHGRTSEGSPNSAGDYGSGYVSYPAGRRSDYGNYFYEQSSNPLLYSGSNCYYQPYDASVAAAHTATGAGYYGPRNYGRLKDERPTTTTATVDGSVEDAKEPENLSESDTGSSKGSMPILGAMNFSTNSNAFVRV